MPAACYPTPACPCGNMVSEPPKFPSFPPCSHAVPAPLNPVCFGSKSGISFRKHETPALGTPRNTALPECFTRSLRFNLFGANASFVFGRPRPNGMINRSPWMEKNMCRHMSQYHVRTMQHPLAFVSSYPPLFSSRYERL